MKNNFKFKILAVSLMTVLGVSTATLAQVLPNSQLVQDLQASKNQPTELNGVVNQANQAKKENALPVPTPLPITTSVPTPVTADPVVAPSVPVTASTVASAPASSSSVQGADKSSAMTDSSKSDPDAERFALSSKETIDKNGDLKEFTKSSENSIYEDDALQTEINLIQKRIQKIALLGDLKRAQDKLEAIKSGKPLDKDGNPIPQKTEEQKKEEAQTQQVAVVKQQIMLPPKPKSQVVAVYGFADSNFADVMVDGRRHTIKVGDSLDGKSVTRITDKGVYLSGGKGSKGSFVPVETGAIGSGLVNNAVQAGSPISVPAGGGGSFGSFAGNTVVTPPSSAPTSFPASEPTPDQQTDLTAPTPLDFKSTPAPPSLMPPSPSVAH